MVANGQLRLGDVQAFIQYSQQFTQPLSELGGMAAVVQSGTASAERVFELLDADEQEADDADAPELVEGKGVIEFENVAFSYTPERPPHPGPVVPGGAGPDGRDRRPDGRRQDDVGQPDHALLRAQRRTHHARRSGHRRGDPRRTALTHWHGAAGPVAVRLAASARTSDTVAPRRPTKRSRRCQGRPTSTASCTPSPRVMTRCSTRMPRTSRRASASSSRSPGHSSHSRRSSSSMSHVGGRHPHRAAAAARDGRAPRRAHVVRDRAPSVDHPRRRPHPRDGARRHRGEGHARRAHRRAGRLLAAVPVAVRAGGDRHRPPKTPSPDRRPSSSPERPATTSARRKKPLPVAGASVGAQAPAAEVAAAQALLEDGADGSRPSRLIRVRRSDAHRTAPHPALAGWGAVLRALSACAGSACAVLRALFCVRCSARPASCRAERHTQQVRSQKTTASEGLEAAFFDSSSERVRRRWFRLTIGAILGATVSAGRW